jgi:hypothetical protein
MAIVLPKLPEPSPVEDTPYCVIAKHRAKPGPKFRPKYDGHARVSEESQ